MKNYISFRVRVSNNPSFDQFKILPIDRLKVASRDFKSRKFLLRRNNSLDETTNWETFLNCLGSKHFNETKRLFLFFARNISLVRKPEEKKLKYFRTMVIDSNRKSSFQTHSLLDLLWSSRRRRLRTPNLVFKQVSQSQMTSVPK